MGKVAAVLRIMPESAEVNLKDLEQSIRKKVKGIQDVATEPIAFGLQALKIAVVVSDDEGGTDMIEKALSEVPQVGQVETIAVNRMI
ncbi:MAG: elongation factor 1-beta [Methanomicrobiales archaeon]|nr:elongation factor 1-beta [Methanomicrobiales archaeon]